MRFTEKLRAITAGLNKSRIAEEAGLSTTAISDYLQKGYTPRGDKALRLARALKVSVEWLLDDEQGLPAPEPATLEPTQLADHELMREVCRRLRLRAIRVREDLNRVEAIDWDKVAKRLAAVPVGSPVPADIHDEIRVIRALDRSMYDLAFWDADLMVNEYRRTLPGANIDPDELTRVTLRDRISSLRETKLRLVDELLTARFSARGWPEETGDSEAWRERIARELDERKRPDREPDRPRKKRRKS